MAIRQHHRPSAVLILALLMMGAIVGSGIALSTVISDSTHQTQGLNDFIAASLVADSGVERGLAVVKQGRASQNVATTASKVTSAAAIPGILSLSGNSTTGSTLQWDLLRPGESVSFDILSPTYNVPLPANSNLLKYSGVTKNYLPSFAASLAKLEISWVGLNKEGDPFFFGKKYLTSNQLTAGAGTDVDLLDITLLRDINGSAFNILTPPDLSQILGYRVRLTAVDQGTGALGSLPANEIPVAYQTLQKITKLQAKGQAGFPGFPSRVEISSTAKINQSQSIKTVSVLWQLTSSPAFRYVLFAEQGIIPK